MGQMIDGRWHAEDKALGQITLSGAWQRPTSILRHQIGDSAEFPAEAGRYHLYAAWNCPWAHRVLLVRAVLGLQDAVPVSMVAPRRTQDGWVFDPEAGYVDTVSGALALHEVYAAGLASYTGRVTVPLLVDRVSKRLVSNESADLVRMLPQAFADHCQTSLQLYPRAHAEAIDCWNTRIHRDLNNGVYKAEFAESQDAYDQAVHAVFATLDAIEDRLSTALFLTGSELTEADLRLFPTLARFDVAYHTAFKCTRRRLIDYLHLWSYARRIYAMPGVRQTVNFDIYRAGYFSQSPKRNPLGIVPVAPEISWGLAP